MADQLETVPMDDKELFSGAMATEQEAPAEQPGTDERPRDEQGRFAPKEAQPEQVKDAQPAAATPPAEQPKTGEPQSDLKDEQGGQVPSWRLREVREAREAADRRAQEHEQAARHYAQQNQALLNRLRELEQPKAPADIFENPQGFVDHGVQQQLNPLLQQLNELRQERVRDREEWSKIRAVEKYGEQAVNDAYKAIHDAARAGSPDVAAVIQETQGSVDPVGALMRWHQQKAVLSKIGGDPEKWFDTQLAERLKDPNFQAQTLERLRGTASTQSNGRPNINLPPSLNKTAGSGLSSADLDDGDMSDKSLFRHSMSNPQRG